MHSYFLSISLLLLFHLNIQNTCAEDFTENEIEPEWNPYADILRSLHEEPVGGGEIGLSRSTVNTSWITQRLDHFNETNKKTWRMRYKSNDMFCQNGGPIFIFVGAEWAISDRPLMSGPIYEMAKEHSACLFYTEHRYYGESHPVDNMSVKNLRYLKVEQALADLEHFIRTIKIGELADSKVIMIGGSLSGAMVTWFRRIYPDMAVGTWASSAPLKLKVNFYEYKEVVGEALRTVGGEKCYTRIENAFNAFARGVAKKNKTMINKILKLCSNFDASNKNDVNFLFSAFGDIFSGFIQGQNTGDIEKACLKIMEGDDDARAVAKWIRARLNMKDCIPLSYKNAVKALRETSWTSKIIGRQWFYQICNQFGWFHTLTSENQPFGQRVQLEFHEKFCRDIFGKEISLDRMMTTADDLNAIYGELNPGVNNIYYTHGYLDPWRIVGVQQNETKIKVLAGYAHCKDLMFRKTDTEDMLALRKDISNSIKMWLEQ